MQSSPRSAFALPIALAAAASLACSRPLVHVGGVRPVADTASPTTDTLPPTDQPRPAPDAVDLGLLLARADVNRYVAVALALSGAVRAAEEAWYASRERPVQSGALPEPRLTVAEAFEEVQTRTGPQQRTIGVSQTFPWPGTLERRRGLAEQERDALGDELDAVRLRVERDVRLAFLDYALLARELEIRRAQAALLRDLEEVAAARVRGGARQRDLLRLQVEVGRLEDDVARLERRRPALSARLAAVMNLPDDTPPLPLPVLDRPAAGERPSARALALEAFESSPELRALGSMIRASRERAALAALGRRPDLTLGVTTIRTGSAVDPQTPGSGDDPWILSLSLPLPVWAASDDAAEREARHLQRAARARLDQARADLVARVERAAFDRDDALRRIELYGASLIPRAREALSLASSAYRAGDTTLLDLIDSERALLEFELSFWSACHAAQAAEVELRAMTGGGALSAAEPARANDGADEKTYEETSEEKHR